ncbi:MAG: transposon-encoded TnpW family protein [Oscillibacter sp.]|nr:transposon-encoded TnpW family protein [Oscillibacter sp.]MEA4994847.1 transposon-encoded TnpW family protein [Oscillibacter sp.]
MSNNSEKTPLTSNAPNLDFERKIGGTTYEVVSRFEKDAKEDMTIKVKRLILREKPNE